MDYCLLVHIEHNELKGSIKRLRKILQDYSPNCLGMNSDMRMGILVPGRVFGHAGGHFGARARIWARGRAFWRWGARLGTRAGILALRRVLGHAGGHFGARPRVRARGRAFWRSGAI